MYNLINENCNHLLWQNYVKMLQQYATRSAFGDVCDGEVLGSEVRARRVGPVGR